jgi:hypothetical protein
VPALHAGVPQRQRLQCRRLAGVFGADEDHGLPQVEGDVLKTLEHPDIAPDGEMAQ